MEPGMNYTVDLTKFPNSTAKRLTALADPEAIAKYVGSHGWVQYWREMLAPYDLRTKAKPPNPIIVRGVFYDHDEENKRILICGCGVVYLPFPNRLPRHCARLFAIQCNSADEERAKPAMLDLINDYLTRLADSFTEGPTAWSAILSVGPFEQN
jgi:hypothetical protein